MDRAAAEEQLATEVSTLLRLIHPVKAAAAREGGAGLGQDRSAMLVLFPLLEGPQRPGTLAELCHSDPSTISRQVAELVRRELVRREPDPSDGRASLLAITEAGREVCERVRALRRELLAAAVAGWTDDELDTFAALLSRFNGALAAAYRPSLARAALNRTAPTPMLTTIAAGAPAGTEQEPA
jgi:DNA-binding MarR family transcriptional regulator